MLPSHLQHYIYYFTSINFLCNFSQLCIIHIKIITDDSDYKYKLLGQILITACCNSNERIFGEIAGLIKDLAYHESQQEM